jgi:hypothetical protein
LYPDAYNFGLKVSNGLLYFPAKYTSVGVEPYVLGAIAPNGLENTASDLEIEMYPNPSNNQLLIKSAGLLEEVKILDLAGKEIYNTSSNLTSEFHINTASYSDGIYFLQFKSGSKMGIQKLVVQH